MTELVGAQGFPPSVTIGPPVVSDGRADPTAPERTIYAMDHCHLVHTEGESELWVGNRHAAIDFQGEKLCMLEDPHCLKASDTHHIAILDSTGTARRERLDAAADHISARLSAGVRLLVHCSAGIERSPLTVAWWLVRSGRCETLEAAYEVVKAARPVAQDRTYWIEPETGKVLTEREKYERMWQHEQYRQVAPGEGCAQIFLEVARPPQGSRVIDFGAGTGRGALMLAIMGMKVEMLDFAENCLDTEVRQALTTQAHVLSFRQQDLTQHIDMAAPYGYCTDVMEHLPTEDVPRVLLNILRASQHVFFQISCTDDSCGALIGHPLHLTVKPYEWWLQQLQGLDCAVHWSQDCGTHCLFYVSAWQDARAIVDVGELNVAEQAILENVRTNLEADWPEVEPHITNDIEVMILGGGPSLREFEDEIIKRRAQGMPLITLNGAYNWAIERGMTPSAQIVVDAREVNARFTRPIVDGCKYLIASQAHPSVLKDLPRDRTFLWHSTMPSMREIVNEKRKVWYGIPGGSTVLLRSIPLMRMLGYRKFHLYGCDSCRIGEAHHSYTQSWNTDVAVPLNCGGRIFRCATWHAAQAQEFIDLIRVFGDEIELEIYGDGLLAHILKTGAALAEADQFKLD